MLWIGRVSYDEDTERWLGRSGHYLQNPPPGCLFAIGVRQCEPMLFDDLPVPTGPLLGLCLLGRPIARLLPQDGTWAEITRMVLAPGLPHGTASSVLCVAFDEAWRRGVKTVISYHDRTRHTGCIYRKAGMRKDGTTKPSKKGWGSRDRPNSDAVGATSKRRWRIDAPACGG